jgi:hypothetical protein
MRYEDSTSFLIFGTFKSLVKARRAHQKNTHESRDEEYVDKAVVLRVEDTRMIIQVRWG